MHLKVRTVQGSDPHYPSCPLRVQAINESPRFVFNELRLCEGAGVRSAALGKVLFQHLFADAARN